MNATTLRMAAALMIPLLLMAITGCNEAKTPWQEIEPGLSYVDSTLGQGTAVASGDFVLAHYTGWVWTDGTKSEKPFDSSVERGEPIAFPVGRGMVISGWEKGIVGMHVGGKRTLLISPDLAFGADGRPPVVPPSATLVFDIEIVDVPRVSTEVTMEGTGAAAALGDRVSVHYTGWLWEDGAKGEQFDSSRDRGRPYEFNLGRGMVIPGWDMALLDMKEGTQATLVIPPAMAYGKRGMGSIPANATLCFDVELVKVGE